MISLKNKDSVRNVFSKTNLTKISKVTLAITCVGLTAAFRTPSSTQSEIRHNLPLEIGRSYLPQNSGWTAGFNESWSVITKYCQKGGEESTCLHLNPKDRKIEFSVSFPFMDRDARKR